MPDHTPAVKVDKGRVDEAGKARLADRLRAFLDSKAEAAAAVARGPRTQARQATEWTLAALDHTLQATLGLSLQTFQMAQPLRALGVSERRGWVGADKLPAKHAAELGLARRACVRREDTGQRRYEVTWTGDRRLLCVVTDGGSASPSVLPCCCELVSGAGD